MKVSNVAVLAVFAASALVAQQQPAAPAAVPPQEPGQKIVAVVNGETITRAKLDALYERLGAQMRAQYENTGGKAAFLDNYVRKRLVLQEAIKSGFDKRPDVLLEVEAAKESALFDRYVRDVVAAEHVTESAIKKFYEENGAQFMRPERMRVRHIVMRVPAPDRKGEVLTRITNVFAELRGHAIKPGATANEIQLFSNRFSEAARKYSEDAAAPEGGDLGWVTAETGLDAKFFEAMSHIQRGMMSGVVETQFGYHLIFVEDKQPAAREPFEAAKPAIREFLMAQHGADVLGQVNRLTNELRTRSNVAMYPENLR
jgi:peptidyl-prolyl cis-trans isomerase C